MEDYVIEPLQGPPYQTVMTGVTLEAAIEEAQTKNLYWQLPVVVMEGTRERKTVALVDCQRLKASVPNAIVAGRALLDSVFADGSGANVVELKQN
jgi:hypothetical protein